MTFIGFLDCRSPAVSLTLSLSLFYAISRITRARVFHHSIDLYGHYKLLVRRVERLSNGNVIGKRDCGVRSRVSFVGEILNLHTPAMTFATSSSILSPLRVHNTHIHVIRAERVHRQLLRTTLVLQVYQTLLSADILLSPEYAQNNGDYRMRRGRTN